MRYLIPCLLLLAGCVAQQTNDLNDIEFGRAGGEPEAGKTIAVGDQRYRELGVNAQGCREFERLIDGAVVVLIPGGEYHHRGYWDVPGTEMTDERDWRYLPPMLYDKHEVTNRQVAAFLKASIGAKFSDGAVHGPDGRPWALTHEWGLSISKEGAVVQDGYENHPAVGISGWLALEYARWVGGKLPSGAEFEKAAGGASGLLFPWGSELPDSTRVNNYLHGPRRTTPVGSYPDGASPYGLLDMSGNVYERAFWAGVNTADDELETRLPTMLKGGAWVSPNWSNMRCVDRCGQGMDDMEGSVGFRVVASDPAVLKQFVVEKPKLRTFTNTLDAYMEAEERNVPIFLYQGYERCGQCDRVVAQLFTHPKFVEYCNANLVVLIGHNTRDFNDMPKTPVTNDGIFFVHTGAKLADMQQVWWDFSLWREARYVPLPDSVPLFRISPGLVLLNPHRKQIRNPDDAVLMIDDQFHGMKGGGNVDWFIEQFKQAQTRLGQGLTLAEYVEGADSPETIWKPTPEDAALWEKASKDMQALAKALREFAKANDGRYPEAITDLRDYFPHGRLPQDPFLGDYFRYEVTEEGFTLTCYGAGDKPGGDEVPEKDVVLTHEG